jgi:hypothetical protein
MAAFSLSRPRVAQRAASNLAEIAKRSVVAAGEIALLLWMALALAFSLLLMAGFWF